MTVSPAITQTGPVHSSPADGRVVALDVGGTTLKGAVVSADGTTLVERSWPTMRERGPDIVIQAVCDAVAELCREPAAAGAGAVGLAVPGVVDVPGGRAVWSENLRWRDVPIRDLVSQRTGLPVALGHDVRAGGLAETRAGAGHGAADVLFVPIGTGIAAAIVADSHLIESGGYAGELGHLDVGHGEPCACGGTGCLEAIASAAAIARRYADRSSRPTDGAAEVAAAVRAGDPIASVVWCEAVDALGHAFAAAVTLLAPERIIVGGGLAQAGGLLLTPLEAQLESRLTFHRRPQLVTAVLGDRAGCLGAALLARDLVANSSH